MKALDEAYDMLRMAMDKTGSTVDWIEASGGDDRYRTKVVITVDVTER